MHGLGHPGDVQLFADMRTHIALHAQHQSVLRVLFVVQRRAAILTAVFQRAGHLIEHGEQLLMPHGLEQIGRHAIGDAPTGVIELAVRTQQHNARGIAPLPQRARQLKAAHVAHHDVGHDQIGAVVRQPVERLLSILRAAGHLEAHIAPFRARAQAVQYHGIIIHDQHAIHTASPTSHCDNNIARRRRFVNKPPKGCPQSADSPQYYAAEAITTCSHWP